VTASNGRGDVLEARAPRFTASDAARIAEEVFGEEVVEVAPLESERDQNFRIRGARGERVLKLSNAAEDPAVVDFEIAALRHVARWDPALPVPRVCTTPRGEASPCVVATDGLRHAARLLTFLPGRPFSEVGRDDALHRDLGASLARLGRALRGFFHPAAGRVLLWDLRHATRLRSRTEAIREPALRALVAERLERFESSVLPSLQDLRAQVIHNDVSRHNTLVDEGGRVAGILDFGDAIHAPLVLDLAVTAAEVLLGAPEPVDAVRELVAAYHECEPLRAEELRVLPDLVATRLAVGLAISAWRVREHPGNAAYIAGDDAQLGETLSGFASFEGDLRSALPRVAGAPRASGVGGSAKDVATSLLARRARHLGAALELFYAQPLHLVRGRGVWLHDADGRAYLDAYNNVPHVGHGHPAVVEAIARQAATLNTNTRYLTDTVVEYAERLAAILPGRLEVCLFVCSGSEANDLAWRIARLHGGGRGAVVVEGAYHGTTEATHALSPWEREGDIADHVRALPTPDVYRGAFRRDEPRLGARLAAAADEAVASLAEAGLAPAAFFVDPTLSSSGIHVAPEGWLAGVFERIRAAGGLCVADEVQSGFGRMGGPFWGFEMHGVVPDIVTLGKPIGNGYPLAAVVTTPEIAASLAEEGEFFSTFGGNPVACAAGLAVLEVIEREGLVEQARRVGTLLREGLESLAGDHAWIGDVRGAGLFLGVELVRDRVSQQPATHETRRVLEGMRERGVLVGSEGPHRNVVKIRPPLVFEASHAARLLEALDGTLRSL